MFKQHVLRLGFSAEAMLNPLSAFPTLSKAVCSDAQSSFSMAYHQGIPPLLGELIERRHFFSRIQSDARGKLRDFCSEDFCEAFLKLVQQTNPSAFQSMENTDVSLTRCLNIMTEEEVYIPTLLVSLGASGEDHWIPNRDTSGCASHVTPEQAFESALMEFLERQNLTSCWLSDQCLYRIVWETSSVPATLRPFLSNLLAQGTVYAINTSLLFSCYAIVVIFVSGDKRDHVQFSIGSSCSLDPQKALSKAFLEMLQSFTLMSEAYSRTDPSTYEAHKQAYSKLTRNFCDMNTRDVHDSFPCLTSDATPCVPLSTYCSFPKGEVGKALEEIGEITQQFFYASAAIQQVGRMCFLGRVVSPDFFIGMDNSVSFNLQNRFSERLGLRCNKVEPVPFA